MNSYSSIAEIEAQIASLANQINPLTTRLTNLQRELREAKSAEFIRVNQIRRDDVEMSSGDDKPWFGTVYEFAKWLKTSSNKNWAEWNTCIYRTSDLVNGRMPESCAYVSDLKE